MSNDPLPVKSAPSDPAVLVAFATAMAATFGALFIGEILGQMPCLLCWYQRIAMFPLVFILGISIWRGDGAASAYGLPFALAGLLLSGWHGGVYAGILPQGIVPCSKSGPSCTDIAQTIAGVPIPFLSIVAFAIVTTCLLMPKGKTP